MGMMHPVTSSQRTGAMLFPYRADLEHDNIPWVTLVVCLLCIFVYLQQDKSERSLVPAASGYCAQKDHSRRFWLTVEKVTGQRSPALCAELLALLHGTGRAEAIIPVLAKQAQPWDTMTASESRAFTGGELMRIERDFAATVPPTLTARLVFDPGTSNFTRMFSAAIAHGSIGHLVGNLFFFVAFAVLIETVVGPVLYLLLLLGFAYGTHISYAVSQILQHSSVPTLGLSGVVAGMIGLFAYLAPHVRIRCCAFFVFFWRTFPVPAWVLAGWFVGWDVYNLLHDKGASNVNFVAHVSGAFIGFLTGTAFFRGARERIADAMAGTSASTARAHSARRSVKPAPRPPSRHRS
jgi:membrane associated rhomboid family serine protease